MSASQLWSKLWTRFALAVLTVFVIRAALWWTDDSDVSRTEPVTSARPSARHYDLVQVDVDGLTRAMAELDDWLVPALSQLTDVVSAAESSQALQGTWGTSFDGVLPKIDAYLAATNTHLIRIASFISAFPGELPADKVDGLRVSAQGLAQQVGNLRASLVKIDAVVRAEPPAADAVANARTVLLDAIKSWRSRRSSVSSTR